MRLLALFTVPLALTACDTGISADEQERSDREIAERVRALNDAGPPMEEVVPDAILVADMEANDLAGEGCTYAPGTSMGPRVVARETDAYMKINSEMVRFAADPGSREMESKSRTLYNGRQYALRLSIDEGPEEMGLNAQSEGLEGTVYLYDSENRIVYQGSGLVLCAD